MTLPLNVFIASSWKNRDRVRQTALRLRSIGCEVYDFTDPTLRKNVEMPPESITDTYHPYVDNYREYLHRYPGFKLAIDENMEAIKRCDLVVLLLPAGNDSHADWALGIGMGKPSIIVGSPPDGTYSLNHLWADMILQDVNSLLEIIKRVQTILSDYTDYCVKGLFREMGISK